MDLRQLKSEAWLVQRHLKGLVSLFLVPIFVPIIFNFFIRTQPNTTNYQALTTIPQIVANILQNNLFPQVLNFIISIFVLSASFTLIEVFRKKRIEIGFADSLRAFSNQIFTPVFVTLLFKRLILICWGILVWIGSLISLLSSYRVLALYTKAGSGQLSDETAQQILNYSPSMLLGLLLIILGLIIALPQYYAYSQAEFILYDQLSDGTYQGPLQVLRQSRMMMQGYKDKRFMLDLSFIGWHLLIFISFGIVGLYIIPYIHTCSVLFYEKLKALKK